MGDYMLWARVILRYGAGGLGALALVPDDVVYLIRDDPEIASIIAAALAVLVEQGRRWAVQKGWKL